MTWGEPDDCVARPLGSATVVRKGPSLTPAPLQEAPNIIHGGHDLVGGNLDEVATAISSWLETVTSAGSA